MLSLWFSFPTVQTVSIIASFLFLSQFDSNNRLSGATVINKLIHHCASMKYELFIARLSKEREKMSMSLSKKGLDFGSFYVALPPSAFLSLWTPIVEMHGFNSALPHVSSAVCRFLLCVGSAKADAKIAKRQHDHIISAISPMLLTYKTQNCSTQEIINRVREMKKCWKIGPNVCSNFIFFIQCGQQKENDPESKKLKIINDLLVVFDTNESKLDYKKSALSFLHQTVGEIVYNIKTCDQIYEEIYKKLLTSNRQKIIYFLSKIKKKEPTFASILQQIVSPSNNFTDISRIINICTLFLLAENWDRFKQADSRLKDPTVVQIMAEAFQRLFYLAYSEDFSIGLLLLNFLQSSKFTLYDEIKQAIAYHLLALHKFYLYSQKPHAAKLIERIWTERMKGAKLLEAYSEYSPNFVVKSQWGQERSLEEAETRSINSRSSNSEVLTLRSNRASKGKQRSTRSSNLYKKLRYIEEELRRCNLERVYLLLQPLKRLYLEFQERRVQETARNAVVSLIVLLIKKVEEKILYRYKCSLLKKAIYLQIMELKQKCFVEANFQYNEKNMSLGLFQCCYIDKGEINFDSFIKFHEKNNYEDSIQTLFSLKVLYEDLNSNSLSGSRLQNFEDQLSSFQFESKVYFLYKNQLNETKKIDAKKLMIVCKLLLLKSASITNNLLVNYAYLMLKQDKIHEISFKKKIDAYSKLMNAQITLQNNEERTKIFLIMGEIFEQFSEQSFKLMDSSIGNKYFQFLRRKEHSPYYYAYYQFYLKINYLKQSLYFLELHNFSQKNESSLMKKSAIQIYERLNNPFKTHLKAILNELKLDESELQKQPQKKEKKKFNFELFVLKLRNQIDSDVSLPNRYEQYYIRDSPRIELWLIYYFRYLQFFIDELWSHKESEQINERLRRYAIIVKYIHLKIEISKQPNLAVTYNDLRIIIEVIQKLRNDDDRNHFYLYFLEILENSDEMPAMEDIYLQNLLKCKNYEQMLAYLRRNLKPNETNTKMKSSYLCYLIKYHFQRSQFDLCLSMITVLAERKQKIPNLTQIYHMELECKYKIMLNYTIQQYLSLINKCIESSSKTVKQSKENHFKYYFKIFRMLFNRYNFTNTSHNQIFLQTFFKFIDLNKILTDNVEYMDETILYLLRFLAQKFDYSASSASKCFQRIILDKFKGRTKHFVPFCNYLIKRISINSSKNHVIKTILKAILAENPKECIWTISFLKNFTLKSQKNTRLSADETNQIEQLVELSLEVENLLKSNRTYNDNHMNWIQSLMMLSLSQTESKKQKIQNFKQNRLPEQLLFMFNKDYYINKVEDIRVLSNGKSAPLQIIFSLMHIRDKTFLMVKVIIKGNVGVKKYRMESNTANFFEEIGLIDSDITYKIIHLSKYLVSIEHRANCGTINSIINECVPEFKKIEGMILAELQKRRTNTNDRRMLQVYDTSNKYENRVKFSEFIYYKAKNIKDWWKKYNNFVRTHAQWSYLGYIVGLGDRHCDNILITDEGKLIHIDFEYALDTGLKLPFPEWVPFRLTSCFVEPLGVLGVYGMYFAEMVNTAKQFEEKQHNIWKALSHFVGSMDTNVCEQVLQRSRFFNLSVNSVESGVAKLISSAKDPELLRLMFEGWRAYL